MDRTSGAVRTDPVAVESGLTGGRGPLVRLAFALLSGGPVFWGLVVVGFPVALLLGGLWVHAGLLELLVAVCALLLLAMWWSGYRYAGTRATIDPRVDSVTLEGVGPPGQSRSTTVDLDRVEAVSVVPLADAVLVRFDYREFTLFEPPDFAVDRPAFPAAAESLRACGFEVPGGAEDVVGRGWFPYEVPVRIGPTPLVLVGLPPYAVAEVGPAVLWSDGTVIAAVVGVWTLARHLTHAAGVRPTGRGRRVAELFDLVVTAVLLGAVAVGVAVI
ncbi:hypothetical protein BRC81_10700 [Halobacteriales archaeon QS_1_68_20]|nr:MAG: hypothetical protein BRC81_10700 [Halobacteriales archaeon QS_1_68_20]